MKNENKLIAEFMGMKYSDERSFNDGEWTHSIRSLSKFKTSWDWLMPVVDTIYNMGLDEQDNNKIGDITHALVDINIEQTHKAVVEFIKSN